MEVFEDNPKACEKYKWSLMYHNAFCRAINIKEQEFTVKNKIFSDVFNIMKNKINNI